MSGSKTFKRDGVDAVDSVLADGTASLTPAISEKRGGLSTFSHSGTKNAQHQTGSTGTVSATTQFDAFGNMIATTGSWKGQFGYGGQFGYQEDSSGLKLLGHRYYDSSTGRFLTRDPSKVGRNWYGYCGNSPTNYFDNEGNQACPIAPPPVAPTLLVVEGGGAAGTGGLGLAWVPLLGWCVAAAVAGWGVGTWLDQKFNISPRITDYLFRTPDSLPADPRFDHRKGARPSTEDPHQGGEARGDREKAAGEERRSDSQQKGKNRNRKGGGGGGWKGGGSGGKKGGINYFKPKPKKV